MRNARPAAHPHLVIALVLLLGTLNCGLNAAPAGNAPPPAPPPASDPAVPPVLLGKIAHIRIFGSKNIRADAIQAVLTQKVGDLYSPPAVEKDRAAIVDMGVFNGPVVLSAAPSPAGGVDLNYTVAENPVVTAIKFTANTPSKEPTIPSGTLLVQMKTKPGQVLNTKVLVSDLDGLFNRSTGYVRKQGYLFDVSSDINIDPPTGVLTIPLVENHVQAIQITGNANVKTADILAQMHTKPGDLYDDKVLQNDLSAIYEMGGFKEVQNWTFTGTTPGQLTVTIPVVERAAGTVDKLDEKQGKTISFLYDPAIRHPPVIQVSINGKPPLAFIVDTGSAPALGLDPWAAAQLGLKKQELTEQGSGYRYAMAPIQGAIFKGTDSANDVSFDIKQATVLDLGILRDLGISNRIGAEQRVAGIIGMGILASFTSRFDFGAKTLTLFSYSHPPLHQTGTTVLPLRTTPDGRPTIHVTLTPNVTADLILDTGSNSTGMPLATVDALHPTTTSYGHSQVYEQIDGLYLCPDLRLPGLNLGTLRVPDVVVNVTPLAIPSLGMDLLAGYRMTVDGPNAQVTLEPLVVVARSVSGWSGIALKHTGPPWSVEGVRAGSPAGKSGVQVGDQFVAINGMSVRGLTPLQFGNLFTGPPGMTLRVLLRRGQSKTRPGKIIHISWIPLDKFSAPHDALDGLILKKTEGRPWAVMSMFKGCPGDQMGLQAGDEITHMNGAPVADMPLDPLMKIMSGASKSIALTVRRTGRTAPFLVKLVAPPPSSVAP